MPHCPLLDIAREEQAQMLAALRRTRYGYLLALHVLLLCAAGRTLSEIAVVLLCSRSSVYRTVRTYRTGTLRLTFDEEGQLRPPIHATVLFPALDAFRNFCSCPQTTLEPMLSNIDRLSVA
jgi:hypothetical protein